MPIIPSYLEAENKKLTIKLGHYKVFIKAYIRGLK